MAFGNGSSTSSAGEGAEQFTHETDEDNFSDVDSSDSENEEVPKAFEPVVPRSGKRTYGVLVEDLIAERRLKNAKLDEQLAFLRTILPGTHEGEERASVLVDAYQYITRLQKCVEDLNTELVPLSAPVNFNAATLIEGYPQETTAAQPTSADSICVLYKHPMVEVKREEGKIEVHIACMNRPGLLVDIMGALDSKRITVLHASIACRQDVLFEALSLEKETLVLHSGPEPLPMEAEDEAVRDIIVRAIRQETSANNSQ
ncbi:hypothetical protein KC19_5G159800 [Ceratodon purpureus]|uniref:ACT domain-containing protein n=1 Tax=Ceratodon purpureus TaxID=3225 RepID=A0A8T0I3G7_CERPU|nr:hypothetical protein KC19_5G159800 [Ceratodon purpureus]